MKWLKKMREFKKLHHQMVQNNKGFLAEQQGRDVWFLNENTIKASKEEPCLVTFLSKREVFAVSGLDLATAKQQVLYWNEQLALARSRGYTSVKLIWQDKVYTFDNSAVVFAGQIITAGKI